MEDLEPRDSDDGDEQEAAILQADHAFASESFGTTAEEAREGESLDELLAEERPDQPVVDEALEVVDDGLSDDEDELVADAVLERDPFAAPGGGRDVGSRLGSRRDRPRGPARRAGRRGGLKRRGPDPGDRERAVRGRGRDPDRPADHRTERTGRVLGVADGHRVRGARRPGRALPLRRLLQQAVLRRNPQDERVRRNRGGRPPAVPRAGGRVRGAAGRAHGRVAALRVRTLLRREGPGLEPGRERTTGRGGPHRARGLALPLRPAGRLANPRRPATRARRTATSNPRSASSGTPRRA